MKMWGFFFFGWEKKMTKMVFELDPSGKGLFVGLGR